MEPNLPSQRHSHYLLAICATGLLVTVLGVWYFLSLGRNTEKQTNTSNNSAVGLNPELIAKKLPSSSANTTVASAPEVYFENYELKTEYPSIPTGIQTYKLKTNFSPVETAAFAAKLKLTNQETSKDYNFVIYTNTTNPANYGELIFNKQTGAFSFTSFGLIKASDSTVVPPTEAAESFLSLLGFDKTIQCKESYERVDLPSRVNVVCHRSWKEMGNMPILNFPGVLNIDENTPLNALVEDDPQLVAPKDLQITKTTNNTDGKTPLSDFNTAIVSIDKYTGRIISIQSNLRFIESAETTQYADLYSPQEALQRFSNHQSELALPVIAGKGYVPWTKVFPKNKAHGRNAIITDFMLIYPELPPAAPQSILTAYYLIRGTSELRSGYTAKFVELVPANRKNLSFLGNRNVAGETTSRSSPDDQGVKQGTFNFPWLTPIPTSTPGPSQDEVCLIPRDTEELTFNIPGVGNLVVARYKSSVQQQPHMLFFKSAPFPASSARSKLFAPDGPVAKQYAILVAKELRNSPQILGTATLATEEDVYSIFETINKRHPLTDGDYNYCNMNLSYAPPTPSCIQKLARAPNNYYNAEYLQVMSYGVAQKILSLQNDGQLQSFADESNTLPDDIVHNLFWLFVYDETTPLTRNSNGQNFCYLSGVSPAIFTYGNTSTVSIKTTAPLTYSYPSLSSNNTWEISSAYGRLVESPLQQFKYLYYEYDPRKVSISLPKEGFVIAHNQTESLVTHTIAPALGLTKNETQRLIFDVQNELSKTNSSYIKVSVANEAEINQALPLTINPAPSHIHRIHLLISTASKDQPFEKPYITPIKRDGYYIVEVGARYIEHH